MSNTSSTEYKVVRFDADTDDAILSQELTDEARGGWKVVTAYHLHHRNGVFFVFTREAGAATS
jgi:hypothetical protein